MNGNGQIVSFDAARLAARGEHLRALGRPSAAFHLKAADLWCAQQSPFRALEAANAALEQDLFDRRAADTLSRVLAVVGLLREATMWEAVADARRPGRPWPVDGAAATLEEDGSGELWFRPTMTRVATFELSSEIDVVVWPEEDAAFPVQVVGAMLAAVLNIHECDVDPYGPPARAIRAHFFGALTLSYNPPFGWVDASATPKNRTRSMERVRFALSQLHRTEIDRAHESLVEALCLDPSNCLATRMLKKVEKEVTTTP